MNKEQLYLLKDLGPVDLDNDIFRGLARYLLIKKLQAVIRKERRRLSSKFRKRRILIQFCIEHGISTATIYRYLKNYKESGLKGLIPEYGNMKSRKCKSKPINAIQKRIDIKLNAPLQCIDEIKTTVMETSQIDPDVKKTTESLINHLKRYALAKPYTYKPVKLNCEIDKEGLEKLEMYKRSRNKAQRDRATAMIMAQQEYSILEISASVNKSANTIYRWLNHFRKNGFDLFKITLDKTKNNQELRDRPKRIVKIIHQTPKEYNINRAEWDINSISLAYEHDYGKKLSASAVRRAIKKTNYTWRRAKKVLTSPDPNYVEKRDYLLKTLHSLTKDEAFFFIDEAGPWPVKRYGGKSLTRKGDLKTFPQYQTIRGRVTFIGALDVMKNQVVWFFIKSKNTDAVTALITILYFRYHGYSSIYLAWDCASWHKSKGVKNCLEWLNNKPSGPYIEIVPLPKQAQYLNVIEAIFGGIKRAVIHNSNYGSEHEMKMAINRHLKDRNRYFKTNPKRAGNKIWDKEYYSIEHIDGGLFKRV